MHTDCWFQYSGDLQNFELAESKTNTQWTMPIILTNLDICTYSDIILSLSGYCQCGEHYYFFVYFECITMNSKQSITELPLRVGPYSINLILSLLCVGGEKRA